MGSDILSNRVSEGLGGTVRGRMFVSFHLFMIDWLID